MRRRRRRERHLQLIYASSKFDVTSPLFKAGIHQIAGGRESVIGEIFGLGIIG